MAGYTKLFSSILASTIWREDDKTRIVWITLLAMADKRGVAEGSVPGLADFARVSITDCEEALKKLSSPDKHSRSKINDGRRIEEVEGGWRLINHGKYREKMNLDERREYLRIKQQEQRAKRQKQSTRRQHASTNVNTCSGPSTLSTHAAPSPSPDDLDPSKIQNHPKSMNPAQQQNAAAAVVPSKKPRFSGQRIVIFDWNHEEFSGYLNGDADPFDLDGWYRALDDEAIAHGWIQPKRDSGAWLQGKFLAECKRRGVALTSVTPTARMTSPIHGSTCQHVPRCASFRACRDKILREAKVAVV